MAVSLPDELIKEILSPALKVTDKEFSDTSSTSPFATYSESTSALLVVCKSWLRVATPLLYHVVVLRSKAQAQALEAVLRKNKLLGSFIKKLRLEGGYGSAIRTIILSAPNVTDLFLTLAIWSSDSVAGLCRSLHMMNLVRLILHDDRHNPLNNKPIRQLVDALVISIQFWKTLELIELPYTSDSNELTYDRSLSLGYAVSKSPSIKTVKLRENWGCPDFLLLIAKSTTLEAIYVDQMTFLAELQINSIVGEHKKLRKLVKLKEVFTFPKPKPVETSPDSTFVPLSSASDEARDNIWRRVLYIAMIEEQKREGDPHLPMFINPNKKCLTVLLVSKTFYRVGLPYLYACPILRSTDNLEKFGNCLMENPSLGLHIRSLFIRSKSCDSLHFILSHAPNLIELVDLTFEVLVSGGDNRYLKGTFELDWVMFTLLANTAGSSLGRLHGLGICKSSQAKCPAPFYSFTNLRSLECDISEQLKFEPSEVPADALSRLENLRLLSADASILNLLLPMSLQALRTMALKAPVSKEHVIPFLEKHGSKLLAFEVEDLPDIGVFDMCPSLALLVIPFSKTLPEAKIMRCKSDHKALIKIVLGLDISMKQEDDILKFLHAIDLSAFPALIEIQIPYCRWPKTEREISKSRWVQSAEDLLDRWNVKTSDGRGTCWIRRLKSSSKR